MRYNQRTKILQEIQEDVFKTDRLHNASTQYRRYKPIPTGLNINQIIEYPSKNQKEDSII